MEELISIVIPVYNAEKYIDRCMESIVSQTYQSIEIIAVDDGSSDKSVDKLREWKNKDKRIKVIEKENTGVSDTRNKGICAAKGTYLCFVDVDDYLEKKYVEVLHDTIVKDETDIVSCNFITEYEGEIEHRKYNYIEKDEVISDKERLFLDCINCMIYTYLVWGKMYKTNVVRKVKFKKQAYSEDALFIRELFIHVSKVSLIEYAGYHYYINEGGVTNDKTREVEKLTGELNMLIKMWKMSKENEMQIDYIKLEDMILKTWKRVIGKAIRKKQNLNEEQIKLLKLMITYKRKFYNKGKGYGYVDILTKVLIMKSGKNHENENAYIKETGIKQTKSAENCQSDNKRKIGVVTIYDLGNFGNRLQNYATIQWLEQNGYQAETLILKQKGFKKCVRTIYKAIRTGKRSFVHWNLLQEDKKYIASLNEKQYNRYQLFKDFSYQYTNIKKMTYFEGIPLKRGYDVFITGSDQVWNPLIGQAADWEFLSFSKDRGKNVSWSASFGISQIPERHKKRMKKLLKNLKYISVRENSAKQIVQELTGIETEILIDPTMMIGADEWRSIEKKPETDIAKDYIFSYFLGGQDDVKKEEIKETAKKNGCIVYNLMDDECEIADKVGPAEFVYMIHHAKGVCTDSFHACVFSILLGVPFCVFDRVGQGANMGSRINSLLQKFELEERTYENVWRKDSLFEKEYENAYKILKAEKIKAEHFLKKALSEKNGN